MGWTWLTGGLCGLEFKRGGHIEWEAREISCVFNDNTSGKLMFLLFTDVSQYKCCDEMILFKANAWCPEIFDLAVFGNYRYFFNNLWNYILIKRLSAVFFTETVTKIIFIRVMDFCSVVVQASYP